MQNVYLFEVVQLDIWAIEVNLSNYVMIDSIIIIQLLYEK